jgi:hypothetical protein
MTMAGYLAACQEAVPHSFRGIAGQPGGATGFDRPLESSHLGNLLKAWFEVI